MKYLGIDPGATGGIAVIDGENLLLQPLAPLTPIGIWNLINRFGNGITGTFGTRAAIELVTGYLPGEGGGANRQPGSHMFNFGRSYGILEMCLQIAIGEDHFKRVHSATWQKEIGAPQKKKGQTGPDHKRDLVQHARTLFPDTKITAAVADAALLAYWCKAKNEGMI